jgi:hypothetical protein
LPCHQGIRSTHWNSRYDYSWGLLGFNAPEKSTTHLPPYLKRVRIQLSARSRITRFGLTLRTTQFSMTAKTGATT